MTIGIAITTHNRSEIMVNTIDSWIEFMPLGRGFQTRFVVVDDGSAEPVTPSTFRFETPQGIAVAKNKCLELLEGCDHIFLADDDIYPNSLDWWKPYIESGLEHACYTFGRRVLNTKPNYIEFEKPCGVLLYMTKKCLETVGGYDTDFRNYGYEHVNLSDRIFNAGLTPARYIDAPLSRSYFTCLDELKAVQSSVDRDTRVASLYHNKKLYLERYDSKQFIPYK